MENQLNDENFDQLKEIINIGASHASTALSQMIKTRVMITVPKVFFDKIENLSAVFEFDSGKVSVALLNIYGDANGIMFFMFTQGAEKKLAKLLVQSEDDSGVLNELEISAVKEVANILAGSCLSAFSKFLDMNLVHSVSDIAVDTIDSIINTIAVEIGQNHDSALIFQVDFSVPDSDINSTLFFFVDPEATQRIIEKVEEKYN